MKFKNVMRMSAGIVVISMLALAGCSKQNPADENPDSVDLESGEFALADANDAVASLSLPTLESDMTFDAGFANGEHFRRGGRFGRGGPRGPFGGGELRYHHGIHLYRVLRQLDLEDTVLTQVRDLLDVGRSCIRQGLMDFIEANRTLLDSLNTERHAIRDSVLAGDLTREEARARFQEMHQQAREAILNNPEAAEALAALCACKTDLFGAIRALLNAEQQEIWDSWVAGLSGRCFDQG